jgi:hypothetical protein
MLTNEVLAQTQQLICEFAIVEHNVMVCTRMSIMKHACNCVKELMYNTQYTMGASLHFPFLKVPITAGSTIKKPFLPADAILQHIS